MDVLIDRRRVEEMTGLSRSTIYNMLAKGTFPKPLRVGIRAVRWRQSAITSWINQLPETLLLSLFIVAKNYIQEGYQNGIGTHHSPLAQRS